MGARCLPLPEPEGECLGGKLNLLYCLLLEKRKNIPKETHKTEKKRAKQSQKYSAVKNYKTIH